MRTLAKYILLAVAIPPLAAAAQAGGRGPEPGPPIFGPPGMGPMGPGEAVMHLDPGALGLSEAQTAAWRKLCDEHMAEARPLFGEHRRLAEEMHAALESPNPDAQAIGEKMIAGHAVMEKLGAMGADLEDRFVALLDDDQKAKYEELKAAAPQARPRRGGHRGFGPGDPHDPPGGHAPDGGR